MVISLYGKKREKGRNTRKREREKEREKGVANIDAYRGARRKG